MHMTIHDIIVYRKAPAALLRNAALYPERISIHKPLIGTANQIE